VQRAPELGDQPRQARLGDVGVAPDARLQLVLGDGVGPVLQQRAQQLEGLGGEVDGAVAANEKPPRRVEHEVVEADLHGLLPGPPRFADAKYGLVWRDCAVHTTDALGARRYRILECLGAGANGEVYLAEDTRLHRQVALKTILAASGVEPEEMRRRMLREARAA